MEEQELTQEVLETPVEPQEEVDWKARYEEVATKAERAESLERQYKNLQRQLEKSRAENVTRSDLTALREQMAAALDAMRENDEYDEPKRKPRPSDFFKEAPKEPAQPSPDIQAKARQADKLMRRLGLSDNEQVRFADEYPDIDEAIDELDRRYEAKLKKDAAEEALLTLRKQQKMSGATKGDGTPSAATTDWHAIRDRFIKDPTNPENYNAWQRVKDNKPK